MCVCALNDDCKLTLISLSLSLTHSFSCSFFLVTCNIYIHETIVQRTNALRRHLLFCLSLGLLVCIYIYMYIPVLLTATSLLLFVFRPCNIYYCSVLRGEQCKASSLSPSPSERVTFNQNQAVDKTQIQIYTRDVSHSRKVERRRQQRHGEQAQVSARDEQRTGEQGDEVAVQCGVEEGERSAAAAATVAASSSFGSFVVGRRLCCRREGRDDNDKRRTPIQLQDHRRGRGRGGRHQRRSDDDERKQRADDKYHHRRQRSEQQCVHQTSAKPAETAAAAIIECQLRHGCVQQELHCVADNAATATAAAAQRECGDRLVHVQLELVVDRRRLVAHRRPLHAAHHRRQDTPVGHQGQVREQEVLCKYNYQTDQTKSNQLSPHRCFFLDLDSSHRATLASNS